jgi:hypothetical protein
MKLTPNQFSFYIQRDDLFKSNLERLEESERIKARIQASIDCMPRANTVNKLVKKLLAQWESES